MIEEPAFHLRWDEHAEDLVRRAAPLDVNARAADAALALRAAVQPLPPDVQRLLDRVLTPRASGAKAWLQRLFGGGPPTAADYGLLLARLDVWSANPALQLALLNLTRAAGGAVWCLHAIIESLSKKDKSSSEPPHSETSARIWMALRDIRLVSLPDVAARGCAVRRNMDDERPRPVRQR